MARERIRWSLIGAACGLLIAGAPRLVRAHGLPIPLAFWGGFDSTAAQCQHGIARAADICGRGAWHVRAACGTTALTGGICDTASDDAALQRIETAALSVYYRECPSAQDGKGILQVAGFGLASEAAIDITNFCESSATAVGSAVYRAPLQNQPLAQLDANARACVAATAKAATALLRVAYRSRRRALDLIATEMLTPSQKDTIVAQSTARIQAVEATLATRLSIACDPAIFQTVYNLSPAQVLAPIAQRADCLSASAYVQMQLLCPAPVCGNGMLESGEQCDDGNTTDGDGCDHACQLE